MAVIFVAGIHGVGKTTCCQKISEKIGIPHYTASQIIRGKKSLGNIARTKVVDDLDENQLILIDGVQAIIKEEKKLLLDGHFTLKTSTGIEAIPLPVFRELSICAIAVYADDPHAIAERIGSRDGIDHSPEFLEHHQDIELEHSRKVAESLSVPIKILSAFDLGGLDDLLTQLI